MPAAQPPTPRLPSLEMRLENFRIFRDSGPFRVAPLTCLVGANSSGKTSVLSSFLLLKQSLEQGILSPEVSPLNLNGPYCDLGSFGDLVHRHNETAQVSFTFSIPLAALRRPYGFGNALVSLDLPQSRFDFPSILFYGHPKKSSQPLPQKGLARVSLSFSSDEPFGPSLSRLEFQIEGVGTAKFVRTTTGERRQHWRVYVDNLPASSVFPSFSPGGFFPVLRRRRSVYKRVGPRIKQRINSFVDASHELTKYVQFLIGFSEMIGPFRTPPERRYVFGGFTRGRSGPSGAQAVNLLITERLLKAAGSPLQAAVSFWLRHLNLADRLSIQDLVKKMNLFEVNLSGAGQTGAASVADVGYGISQVLPVLVQGLLTRRGTIYMVQQPELHLHPDAQAGLADFFLYLASSGVRTIVETHSEYLLIRLRRRLAERRLPGLKGKEGARVRRIEVSREQVAILLASVDGRSGGKVTELEIGDSFQFENLPAGFMDQAVEDRIALLGALGKKA